MPYTELAVTTNFSFLRGASHPEEYVEQAALLGHSAIAITDRCSLAGIVRAHVAAKQKSFSLLIGCSLEISLPSHTAWQRVLCYPTHRVSYGKLSTLLTIGKRRAPKGECLLSISDLLTYWDDLIVIVMSHDDESLLAKTLASFAESVPPEFLFISASRLYEPTDRNVFSLALQYAKRHRIRLVAVNDVHYHVKARRPLQDILTCIRHSCTIRNAGYRLFSNGERYLKSAAEMSYLFRDYPDAIARTQEITERVRHFSLDELKYEYPHEICPQGFSTEEHLANLTWDGARERFSSNIPADVVRQIKHELSLIRELQYEKYFLTVYHIVAYARSLGILCQGRGAAANSAVCYCLGITSVDPSKINILFERFISKERNEPPDIDIDFEHERREEVIQHIYQTFGRNRAALVAEVITYRRRSALRDVGKAFGLSPHCIDALTRTYHAWSGKPFSNDHISSLGLNSLDPLIQQTCERVKEIVGFPRHLSQHVGGFLISQTPLCEIVPIENATMPGRSVIEWDKDDVDVMGMLKIDILALGMLTCIRKALDLVNAHSTAATRGSPLSLDNIPSDDSSVYEMISTADTIGVFQIESRAQMNMLPRLRPCNFYDLVIEVAIVRPGPILGNMVHPYLRRRSGIEPISYPNEEMHQVLSRTLGIPLFQEQAMQLAIVGAGFSPGEADQLRRAIAGWKRKGHLIPELGRKIVEGMISRGYDKSFAERCFEQIKGFGEYGFPESHAASFALLVYASAWLKFHYPAAFAVALLNSQPMGFYQPAQILQDAKNHGVQVFPIDINFSSWDCALTDCGRNLRLGFGLIRGIAYSEATLLSESVRQHGMFSSLRECWRNSGIRVSTLRLLAQADAFQSLNLSRQETLWEIRSLRDRPLPLFDSLNSQEEFPVVKRATPEQEVHHDYQHTGFSLKVHPLSFIRKDLEILGIRSTEMIRHEGCAPHGIRASVCGLVLVRQRPSTASGVVFVTLEDETGVANLIIRSVVFEQHRYEATQSICLCATGLVQRQGQVVHILVESLRDMTAACAGYGSASRDFH